MDSRSYAAQDRMLREWSEHSLEAHGEPAMVHELRVLREALEAGRFSPECPTCASFQRKLGLDRGSQGGE